MINGDLHPTFNSTCKYLCFLSAFVSEQLDDVCICVYSLFWFRIALCSLLGKPRVPFSRTANNAKLVLNLGVFSPVPMVPGVLKMIVKVSRKGGLLNTFISWKCTVKLHDFWWKGLSFIALTPSSQASDGTYKGRGYGVTSFYSPPPRGGWIRGLIRDHFSASNVITTVGTETRGRWE